MLFAFIFLAGILSIQYFSLKRKYEMAGIYIQPLFTSRRKILEKYFLYFKNLDENNKQEFLRRVNMTIRTRLFIAKDGLLISGPMKTLIAGSLVQLTFGMKYFLLPNYKTINVFPDAYLNQKTNKYYKGETNTLGYITLSWKHFIEGYLNNSDRLNIGLHEMAHALLNTIIYSEKHDKGLDDKLVLLDKIPEIEKQKLLEGNDPFFRDYAFRNIREFFAVTVECFFESPDEFNNRFPEFYKLMCNLLNQNPAQKQYRLG